MVGRLNLRRVQDPLAVVTKGRRASGGPTETVGVTDLQVIDPDRDQTAAPVTGKRGDRVRPRLRLGRRGDGVLEVQEHLVSRQASGTTERGGQQNEREIQLDGFLTARFPSSQIECVPVSSRYASFSQVCDCAPAPRT
jgi:hypothetical protein